MCSDLITTRSWRVGARLVQEDLGVSITGASVPAKDVQPQLSTTGNDREIKKPILSSDANAKLKELVKIDSGTRIVYCTMGIT
jgi:hypothetical protein